MRALIGCLIIAVGGCGDDGGGATDAGSDAAVPRSATAVFEPPASGPASFGDLPFPHDLYLGADGTVDIAALHLSTPVWESVRDAVDLRRGFCTSCGVHFPIDGALDRAAVPPSADYTATASVEDAVLLFDADPDSPERGTLFPLRVQWTPSGDVLSVLPVRGVVLAPGRTYGAALTDRVLAEDGSPLATSEAFAAARDGGGDATAERARTVMQPALETLTTLGVPLERVVSLAVFTTDAPLDHARALRDIVDAAPAPVAAHDTSTDRVWRGDELDVLLGIPAENRPGWDVPAEAGQEGSTAMVHETTELVLTGSFMAPRVVEGEADADGPVPLRMGDDGLPVAGPQQRVPFTLIVPSGVDVTALPLMIFHTGTNDHRQLAFLAADPAGRAGMAVLAVDHFTQGERAASGVDDRHWAREHMDEDALALGPDGLFEHNGVQVAAVLLGVGSSDEATDGSPTYLLGLLAQQVADDLATFRLVREGDWSAVAAAAPELAGLAFDPDRIAFFGGNQGAAVGAVALAVAEGIAAANFYSPFGSWTHQLVESPDVRANFLLTAGSYLGFSGPFDEIERRSIFDIGLDLYKWVIEPIEPEAAMRAMYADPEATGRPHLLMQLMEFDEWVGPPTSEVLVASAGVPGDGDFEFAAIATATAPVSANVTTADGARTALAYEMPGATHFAILQAMGVRRTEQPLVPPFTRLDPEVAVTDPIVEVHAQIEHFLSTFVETGVPEVCAIGSCATP